MVTVSLRSLVVGAVAALLIGCGGPADRIDKDYMKNAEGVGKTRRDIFTRANQDYNSMSAEDKKTYLDTFKGDEASAKRFWEFMKAPRTDFQPGISRVGSGNQ